jgi:PmbA protein
VKPAEPELLAVAQQALALTRRLGAEQASIMTSRKRQVETVWRDGKLDKVVESTSRSLEVRLYTHGRYGEMSTSDLRPAALERFLSNAIGMVRALAPDAHRTLPDVSLYAHVDLPALELFDPAVVAISHEARIERLQAMEAAARAMPQAQRIVSITGSHVDSDAQYAQVTSNGMQGTYQTTLVNAQLRVNVQDSDGRRPDESAQAVVRFLSDLPEPAELGREAAVRAIERLGAKKIPSKIMPVLIEARAARNLLRHLITPLLGRALQQKQSLFEGALGRTVASPRLTLIDDPLRPRGLGSSPFDAEGIASTTRPLIERGVFRAYLLDVYYANKLGMRPTTGEPTNLVVALGARSLPALQRDITHGLLVTRFIGGNSNPTTGKFSLGVSGFELSRGQRGRPVAELNIAGTQLALWKHMTAVANDPFPYSPIVSPSLQFEAVSVSGI